MSARLIVNADDMGLTRGVNRGIVRAHREGIVTSTSLIALGSAADDAIALLGSVPDLAVGLHLAAVGEDPPLLGAAQIPTLVDRRGRLHNSWRTFLPRFAAGRIDLDDLEREFTAQHEFTAGSGLTLTHLDSHQHLHLWPPIGALLARLATTWRVPAIRTPRTARRSPLGRAIDPLSRRLEAELRAAGISTPNASAGIDQAGHLDLRTLAAVVPQLRKATDHVAELGCHPGEAVDPERARYRWGYQWDGELAVLTSSEARRIVAESGFELSTYANLA